MDYRVVMAWLGPDESPVAHCSAYEAQVHYLTVTQAGQTSLLPESDTEGRQRKMMRSDL